MHPINLVFEGDSLTAGYNLPSADSYPSQMCVSVAMCQKLNYAVAGSHINPDWEEACIPDRFAAVDASFNSDYRDNVLFVWAGNNDLRGESSVQECYDDLATYCIARKAIGFKIVVFTLTACTVAGSSEGYEAIRQTFNTLLRAGYTDFADGLCDAGAHEILGSLAVIEGVDHDTYWIDHIHMAAAGYTIVAGLAATVMAAL